MRILITGGAGFIGSHLVEHFQGQAEIRVLDNLVTGHRQNLQGYQCEFIEGSILDPEILRAAMRGVDLVFHLAAMVSVPESVENPLDCVATNAQGTLLVLAAAAQAGVKKLIFSSSAAIYGDNPVVPKVETMMPEPISPYAVTKLDGEFYCQMFTRLGRLPTVSLRYFNVFGPRQNPRSAYAAAVPIFIDRALRGEPLVIHGDGGQTRDFVFVKEVVAANAHFALKSPATGVFNVAGGEGITILALAEEIQRLTGAVGSITRAPERAGDVRHSVANISKLRAAGFVPASKISATLPATIQFYAKPNQPL